MKVIIIFYVLLKVKELANALKILTCKLEAEEHTTDIGQR